MCVRVEFETEQTATYWHQVPLTIAALPFHSAGRLNRGSLSPLSGAGSHCLELQLELQLQLTPTATDSNNLKPSVAPGYIIVWPPPASCGRRICTEFIPSTGQGDIFDRRHLFLDWRLGRRSICYSFIFCSRNVFGFFLWIMAPFKLAEVIELKLCVYQVSKLYMECSNAQSVGALHIHIYSSMQIITLYYLYMHDNINHVLDIIYHVIYVLQTSKC